MHTETSPSVGTQVPRVVTCAHEWPPAYDARVAAPSCFLTDVGARHLRLWVCASTAYCARALPSSAEKEHLSCIPREAPPRLALGMRGEGAMHETAVEGNEDQAPLDTTAQL